jgi:L-seryl-tRNA(Ser) seleniumtransferase
MTIYDEIGVRPFINAAGVMFTRYGGSIMLPEVVAAMAEASKQFVNIFDLQDRMGDAIAKMTNNEAAFVSCGAASGILLSVAACIAGTDKELAERLPDTQGMRNQVIMRRNERGTECDPAVRAAGGKIIEVEPKKVIDAINEQTVAIVLIAFEPRELPEVRSILQAAHARNIPVLIDGACAVPPIENLWHYTRDLGVDAFITSGGKSIGGPQSTGLVFGKRSIIEGCKFHSSPNLRLGRGMKVGKEEFAGIYTALKLFLAKDFAAEAKIRAKQISHIAGCLFGLSGFKLSVTGSTLEIELNQPNAEAHAKSLLAGEPSILLQGRGNKITVRAGQLQSGEERIVGKKLRDLLNSPD